ncbi:MAG TPA: iron chelate uptake ABC transporter family permease subunit, partial [Polyangia bacterium]
MTLEMTLKPPPLALAAFVAAGGVVVAFALGLLSGSSGWGWPTHDIFWLIRVPRVLAAFGTGAALALAGALIQLVTRNPLGDPHVLGVTSGASVGALLAILLLPAGMPFGTEIGAMLGAALTMTLVFSLAWRSMGQGLALSAPPGTVVVLLVGVMVGAACVAVESFIVAVADDSKLHSLVFWLLGDLNGASLWWPVWGAAVLAFALAWPKARELDWLARGDAWAWTIG